MLALIALLTAGSAPAAPAVSVRDHAGRPTAFVDDQRVDLNGRLWRDGDGWIDGAKPGSVVVIPATAASDPYGWVPDVWTSRETRDYAQLDGSIGRALRAEPDAWIVLRVFLAAPEWWMKENARETMLFGHGRHSIEVPGIAEPATFASYASEIWREDLLDAVRRFVSHVEGATYADRVIGYWLADGEEGRWRYWGASQGHFSDYSRPQQTLFRSWLRRKYDNDIRRLRSAWQRIVNPLPGMRAEGDDKPVPAFLWEDVRVPAIDERCEHRSQSLLDPAFSPEVIDYNHFHARCLAEHVSAVAATAKEAAGSKLIGVSYGQLLQQAAGKSTLQNAGQIRFSQVLVRPEIDFIAAPLLPESAGSEFSSLRDSIGFHGKIWVVDAIHGEPTEEAVAQAAVAGGGVFAGGATPARIAPLVDRASEWDRSSASEIAVIVDHYSLAYLADGNALSKPLLHDQFAALGAMGAPYDVWMLDDLIAGRVPPYKLTIMLNAFYLDGPAREAILEQVARDNRVVLWVFAPGAIDDTLSGSAALKLTGLPIGFATREGELRVRVTDSSHPLIDGTPKDLEYGATEPSGPVFYSLPNRVGVLGVIDVPVVADKPPAEWAGLAAREFDTWTSVYSAAPNVPVEILRGLARYAGVHVYAEAGWTVRANASAIAVTARSAGEKMVHLKRTADVIDAVTGETLSRSVGGLNISLREGETRVLEVDAPQ